jgi:hypothetical protein
MPKFDPWNPPRHGFPRADAPAFQREWQAFEPSAVALNGGTSQPLIESPSATHSTSGTIFVWGFSFVTPSTAARGGVLKDDDGMPIGAAVGCSQGPYFLTLSTPIKLPQNSGLNYEKVGAHTANSYVTPYYIVSTENSEEGY